MLFYSTQHYCDNIHICLETNILSNILASSNKTQAARAKILKIFYLFSSFLRERINKYWPLNETVCVQATSHTWRRWRRWRSRCWSTFRWWRGRWCCFGRPILSSGLAFTLTSRYVYTPCHEEENRSDKIYCNFNKIQNILLIFWWIRSQTSAAFGLLDLKSLCQKEEFE